MKIVLKRLADPKGHVKIIEIAGGASFRPSTLARQERERWHSIAERPKTS